MDNKLIWSVIILYYIIFGKYNILYIFVMKFYCCKLMLIYIIFFYLRRGLSGFGMMWNFFFVNYFINFIIFDIKV